MDSVAALREIILKISADNADFLEKLSDRVTQLVNENATWRDEVNQAIRANLEEIQNALNAAPHHHHETELKSALMDRTVRLVFSTEPTHESAFSIWMNGNDHPLDPGTYVIKARNVAGGEFEATEAPLELEEYLMSKYIEQNLDSNQWHYVSVYRLSAEPVDETSTFIE